MSFESELAVILKTTEKNAIPRAAGLRILPVCGRCGGCGHYSYNQISGSVCFGCGGTGQTAPKKAQMKNVLESAAEAMADGRFEDYIEKIACAKRVKNGLESVLTAWKATGIAKLYDWTKGYETSPTATRRDIDISAINKKMSNAYTKASAAYALTYTKDKSKKEAAMKNCDAAIAEALSEIAAANDELQKYLKENAL